MTQWAIYSERVQYYRYTLDRASRSTPNAFAGHGCKVKYVVLLQVSRKC